MRTRTPSSSSVLVDVVDGDTPKLDPRWDHARKLLAEGRHTAALLAEEIERLRADYSRGHGGARRGSSSQLVNLNDEGGFVAALRDQLGLHPMQAKRLVENTARTHLLAQITDAEDGEQIALPDGGGALEVTEDVRAAARDAFQALTLGNVTAGRAWAGFRGALATKSTATAPKNRAPVDHFRNLERALGALATSFPHWAELRPEQRLALERGWEALLPFIPETFAR